MKETYSLGELPEVGQLILDEARSRGTNIIALYGPMGSGKTTLTGAICELLEVQQTPSSPTFAIINTYTTSDGDNVNHFDFYRIKNIEEAYDFGYQEYFYSDELCIVEWPELVEGLLPAERTLIVKIEVTSPSTRKFTII
ncbi:MAG: tRNA (adenosine(37)-N6)-threonylcarbamoyltransferase complex ATPase subunit type 1 TsaE [Mucinivorans sp.]